MNTDTVTIARAKEAVDTLVVEFGSKNEFNAEDLEIVINALESENTFLIRDYLLGLADNGLDFMIEFANELKRKTPLDKSKAIITIAGAYTFEKGDTESALKHFAVALDIDPNYSLAQLLTRVANAGWRTESFATMREELHPKVVAEIASQGAELI